MATTTKINPPHVKPQDTAGQNATAKATIWAALILAATSLSLWGLNRLFGDKRAGGHGSSRSAVAASPTHPSTPISIVRVDGVEQPVNACFTKDFVNPISDDGSAGQPGFGKRGREFTTFNVVVHNSSVSAIEVVRIEFTPSQIRDWFEGVPRGEIIRQAARHAEIDHRGHVQVPFIRIERDKSISSDVSLKIAGNSSRTLSIWFRRMGQPTDPPIDVTGFLLLKTKEGAIASERITLKVRPDELSPFDPAEKGPSA